MKKYYKYILAIAAVAFSLTACKKEEEILPGEADNAGCYGVYFPSQEASGSHTYDPTMDPSAEIIVKRTNSKGAITVPVEISDEAGVYTVAPITFADGQSETTVKIDFPNAEMGKEYPLSITITDPNYASKYNDGAISFDFSVLRVEWKKFYGPGATDATSKGHITEVCWEEEYDVDMYYYETAYENIRYCYLEKAWNGNKSKEDYIFYWNTKTNNLYVPMQYIGYINESGAQVYESAAPDFYNAYYSWGEVCPSEEYFSWATSFTAKNSFFQPYYDGNGCFYLGDWTYSGNDGVPTGSGYQWGGTELDADQFIAAGFTRVDYSLGASLDYSTNGILPIYLTTGADIASLKVAGFEGELSAAAIEKKIAAMEDGSEQSTTISTENFEQDGKYYYGEAELTLPATGTYTIIVLGLDKSGKVQATTSAAGPYVTGEDSEKEAVVLSVNTEKISDRYKADGYDATNAFGFYMSGTGVTSVNYAVVKTESYEAYENTYKKLVKAGGDGINQLTQEEVDSLGAFGGYANIVTDLDALTSYTVVVYATNASQETWKTAEYTTDGLPNEVIVDGTAAYYYKLFYTDDDYNPVLDPGYNLEYNPNTNMYEIPNWGSGVNFKFSWDKETGDITIPTQYIGYSYTGYGDFYVIEPKNLPESWIDYFEIDTTKKSYVDEDGNFHFYVAYYSTAGYYYGSDYEILYLKTPETPDSDEDVTDSDENNTGSDENVQTESLRLNKNVKPSLNKKSEKEFVRFTRKAYNHEAKSVNMKVAKVSGRQHASKTISTLKSANLEK